MVSSRDGTVAEACEEEAVDASYLFNLYGFFKTSDQWFRDRVFELGDASRVRGLHQLLAERGEHLEQGVFLCCTKRDENGFASEVHAVTNLIDDTCHTLSGPGFRHSTRPHKARDALEMLERLSAKVIDTLSCGGGGCTSDWWPCKVPLSYLADVTQIERDILVSLLHFRIDEFDDESSAA